MSRWQTGVPEKSGIYDVTVILFRVPGHTIRVVAVGAWETKKRRWEIMPGMLGDGQVIAWAERRKPWAGAVR